MQIQLLWVIQPACIKHIGWKKDPFKCTEMLINCRDFYPNPTRFSCAGIIGKGTTSGNCTMYFPTLLLKFQRLDTNFPDSKQWLSFFFIFLSIFCCREMQLLAALRLILGSPVNLNAHSHILRNRKYCKISSNILQKRRLKTNTAFSQWKRPKKPTSLLLHAAAPIKQIWTIIPCCLNRLNKGNSRQAVYGQ